MNAARVVARGALLGELEGVGLAQLRGPARCDLPVAFMTSRNRWFMYNEARNPRLVEDRSDDVRAGKAGALARLVDAPDAAEPFVYFTAQLPSLWPEQARAFAARWGGGGGGGGACAVWIASRGSGTRAHYDALDNVVVQVAGAKRLRVWSPSQHLAAHVYPDSHPRARKSQLRGDADLVQGAAAAAGAAASADASAAANAPLPLLRELAVPVLDIELAPGDAVAIPAFFIHELETLTETSVSCNAFRPSAAAALAARAFARRLPPLMAPPPQQQQLGTPCLTARPAAFAAALFAALPETADRAGSAPGWFARTLLQSRFAPLGADVVQSDASERWLAAAAVEVDVRPWVESLAEMRALLLSGGGAQDAAQADVAAGVVQIVAAHLAELWAVTATQRPADVPQILSLAQRLALSRAGQLAS